MVTRSELDALLEMGLDVSDRNTYFNILKIIEERIIGYWRPGETVYCDTLYVYNEVTLKALEKRLSRAGFTLSYKIDTVHMHYRSTPPNSWRTGYYYKLTVK